MTEDKLLEKIKDPWWRITSGHLYKIMIKGDSEDDDGEVFVVPFIPNDAQLKFLKNYWYRNLILKARQLGFSTLVAIVWLDHALFVSHQRCGIIADCKDNAEIIFRDKVKFAYDNLPEVLRNMFPLKRDSMKELLFGHNDSSIRVATSVRSGTINRLHISEMGKICAKYPDKAREIKTGSIPAVPKNGIIVVESTAEGTDGDFYQMSQDAEAKYDSGAKLGPLDYQFHFYPWFENPEYWIDAEDVIITEKDNEYFDEVEAKMGIELTQEQCAWYVTTRDNVFKGEEEMMWREYPSTPEEPFKKSLEGTWYKKQMTSMRKEGRIKRLPIVPSKPCLTFWDIGNTDGTAVWIMQRVGHEYRLIDFYECWGEPYSTVVQALQQKGYIWDTMFLPHDAKQERQGKHHNKAPIQMLRELMPGINFVALDRIEDITWGIQQTRDVFPLLWIDDERCKDGITHLDMYRKKWNHQQARWIDIPNKADGHSEAADALRVFGEAMAEGLIVAPRKKTKRKKRKKNWKTV